MTNYQEGVIGYETGGKGSKKRPSLIAPPSPAALPPAPEPAVRRAKQKLAQAATGTETHSASPNLERAQHEPFRMAAT